MQFFFFIIFVVVMFFIIIFCHLINNCTLWITFYSVSIAGLTERWENLSQKAEEAQRASVLQREMAAMHLEFRAAHERLSSHEIILGPAHVIEKSINSITVSRKILIVYV